jgi:hypothetical protein
MDESKALTHNFQTFFFNEKSLIIIWANYQTHNVPCDNKK